MRVAEAIQCVAGDISCMRYNVSGGGNTIYVTEEMQCEWQGRYNVCGRVSDRGQTLHVTGGINCRWQQIDCTSSDTSVAYFLPDASHPPCYCK